MTNYQNIINNCIVNLSDFENKEEKKKNFIV